MLRFSLIVSTVFFTVLMFCSCNDSSEKSPAAEAEKPDDTVQPADSEFEKWRELCYHSDSDRVDHAAAVEMSKLAKTYNNWEWVRVCADWDTDLDDIAVKNLAKLAKTSNEICWVSALARGLGNYELETSLINKLTAIANSSNQFNDWLQVSIATEYSDERLSAHLDALKWMAETAITANDWTWVFQMAPTGSVYRQTALQRLNQLNPSFDNWFDIARVSLMEDDQATFQPAFAKMVQTAEDFYDWRWVYEWSTPGSETEKLALRKMSELAGK